MLSGETVAYRAMNVPAEEPDAGIPHVRICGGRGARALRLPDWLVVVPVWQVKTTLQGLPFTPYYAEPVKGAESAVRELGGNHVAANKLNLFLSMPRSLLTRLEKKQTQTLPNSLNPPGLRMRATILLTYCGKPGWNVLVNRLRQCEDDKEQGGRFFLVHGLAPDKGAFLRAMTQDKDARLRRLAKELAALKRE